MEKCIVLCADDYGQAPAISKGILELVKLGRLSAVSCMVTSDHWQEHSTWLTPFRSRIDIGLHFNLTEDRSSLSQLMLKSIFRQLNPMTIAAELNLQIDRFIEALGQLPAFIDGHQHIHQFPVIRDVLISVYQRRFKGKKPYIRVINENVQWRDFLFSFKRLIIKLMGTKALKALLLKKDIPHNQSFSGIYNFSESQYYAKLFPQFLKSIGEGGVIMCHPGLSGILVQDDPIALARYDEYNYIASDQFLVDCAVAGVVVRKRA